MILNDENNFDLPSDIINKDSEKKGKKDNSEENILHLRKEDSPKHKEMITSSDETEEELESKEIFIINKLITLNEKQNKLMKELNRILEMKKLKKK